MTQGFMKNKQFHPIKKTVRKKNHFEKKSLKPEKKGGFGVALGLGKPKPSAQKLMVDIKENFDFRARLVDKNEELFEKIETGGDTTFTKDRREQFNKNKEVIRDLQKEIKKDIGRLDKDEREKIPTNIKQGLKTFR